MDRTTFEDTWRRKRNDTDSFAAAAEIEGVIVDYVSGYAHATFYANGPTAWVDEIYVRKHMRRKGIGRRLMEGFARWAKERGCKLVALASRGASKFYQAFGYEDTARYYKRYL